MTGANININEKREQWKISRSFAFYNLGIFLCWMAYMALFNLQSSINVEDGLGTTTLAAMFIASVLCGIFGAPVAMRKFGTKTCIIVGDACMFPYMLANLYPTYYTLLPAGILMAILQSPFWPSMSMMNVLYASQYSGVSKRKKSIHVIYFSGYLFTVFQASQVCGSLLAYIVLYGFDQIPLPETVSVNCTDTPNITCQSLIPDYSHCGVNDCQNATIIEQTIEQYKPVNDKMPIYVLVGICLALELLAVLVHGFLLPRDEVFAKKIKEYEDARLLEIDDGEGKSIPEDDNEMKELYQNKKDGADQDLDKETDVTPREAGLWCLMLENAQSFFKHLINIKLLLVAPITLYNGLAMSIVETELTRSLASCVLGVQWVGICMAIYGVSDSILSWVVGKFGRKIGRIPMFIIALVLECGNYVYCIFWSAKQPNILFSILAMFFAFGFTDGIFQMIVNVTHLDFFPENPDVAIPVWNVIVEIGLALGYGLSTVFCVKTRVYFNMAVLIVGCIGVVIADVYHRKTTTEENLEQEKEDKNRCRRQCK